MMINNYGFFLYGLKLSWIIFWCGIVFYNVSFIDIVVFVFINIWSFLGYIYMWI